MQQQTVYSSVAVPMVQEKSFSLQLRNNATTVVWAKQQCEIKHVLPQWHSVWRWNGLEWLDSLWSRLLVLINKMVKVGMVFSSSYNSSFVIRLIRLGLLQLPCHTPESHNDKSYLSLSISIISAFSIQVCCQWPMVSGWLWMDWRLGGCVFNVASLLVGIIYLSKCNKRSLWKTSNVHDFLSLIYYFETNQTSQEQWVN